MLSPLLQNVLFSALVPKVMLSGALLIVLRSLAKNDTDNILSWAYAAVALLLLRDIAAPLVGWPFPTALLDTALPLFPAGMLFWKTRRKLFYGHGIFSVLVLLAMAAIPRALSFAAVLSTLALLGSAARPSRDGEAQTFHSNQGRLALAAALIVPPLFKLAFPAALDAYHLAAVPFSYLGFIFSALEYGAAGVRALSHERDEMAENIDTLYNFVLHSSDSLRAGGDLGKLMGYVAETLTEGSDADGSLVLMIDDFEDLVSAYALHGSFPPILAVPESVPRSTEAIREWLAHVKVRLGEGLIGETAQSGKAVFLRNAEQDPRVVTHPSLPAGSLIAVPFLIKDRVIGVGLVARRKGREPFSDAQFDRVSLLADFASLVINNIFSFQDVTERSDIDFAATIAEDIQRALHPKRLPKHPLLSLGVFTESARGVCGDYYDVIAARNDRIYLVMGDVAGKGIQAGLIMVMVRAILHLVTNADKDAATILNWINRGITGKIDIDHFATLQIVVIDPTTGDCEFANAGHRPPLVWRQGHGLVDALENQSDPIGVARTTEYKSIRFALQKDDVLLFYTDGVIETINAKGRQYGVKSLTNILHKHHDSSAADIVARVQDDIKTFIGSARQHDDRTVLVVKAKI